MAPATLNVREPNVAAWARAGLGQPWFARTFLIGIGLIPGP